MERIEPRDRGFEPGEALSDRGRARRFRTDGGGELWRLAPDDAALAERLLELSSSGVGGFVDGGVDDDGPWLLRSLPSQRLSEQLRKEAGPWPWRRALALASSLTRALAACEAASLFAGALTPSQVAVALTDDDPNGAHGCLPADPLVDALVGAPRRGAGSDSDVADLLYAPPEQADGRLWDAAANRYALGVIVYQMLSGEHPFGGAGLRHALQEAQQVEPAPFAADVVRELPPGLMSACLRWIDPYPAKRPPSASELLAELDEIVGGTPRARASHAAKDERAREPSRGRGHSHEDEDEHEDEHQRARFRVRSGLGATLLRGRRMRYLPLLVGVVACALALATVIATPDAKPRSGPRAGDVAVLTASETEAQDCADCHPRHAAEWSQSVMGHSVRSPLFNGLEALIEEQVGRDDDCPGGAGILRRAGSAATNCRDRASGVTITGSGGEHWCVNCHSPGENLASAMPAWQGARGGDPRTRLPVRDLLKPESMEGISCAFCHQVHGPVGPNGSPGYQGNPGWVSFVTGRFFASRPEDTRGVLGIANSGYRLDPGELLLNVGVRDASRLAVSGPGGFASHLRPTDEARRYLASSRFCGSCHDVRLFGSDVLGVAQRGEHFKRLRNAYSEWSDWAAGERAAGRTPASCQDCHMSSFPGACEPGERPNADPIHDNCPEGTKFVAHQPGRRVSGRAASNSAEPTAISPHYFTGVDLPLAREISDAALDAPGLDAQGTPLSAKKRRNLLLSRALRLDLEEARRAGSQLEVPVVVENVWGGHKVPAGFSQEREIWVHLRVEDARGGLVYEVGRVDRNDEDLRDKVLLRVNTDPDRVDGRGRPLGLFGADVRDGPDVPRWSPRPELGGSSFRGRGLINFQNGFLRCVRCIGEVSPSGECLPSAFERHRAERFADGDYDIDTGECRSNLFGRNALFETYLPVGSLDADRGFIKGPDAIIDTRSLSPNRPVRYTYLLPIAGRQGPFTIIARLMFRSFPPFLVRAFAEYEAKQAQRGRRPSGPLVTSDMLERLERVELSRRSLVVP